jgi:hypothetical protein
VCGHWSTVLIAGVIRAPVVMSQPGQPPAAQQAGTRVTDVHQRQPVTAAHQCGDGGAGVRIIDLPRGRGDEVVKPLEHLPGSSSPASRATAATSAALTRAPEGPKSSDTAR